MSATPARDGQRVHLTIKGEKPDSDAWVRAEILGFGSRSITVEQLYDLMTDDDSWDVIRERLRVIYGK